MSNALKKITTRAKQLRKKFPNTKWTTLTKKASVEYRQGKLGKVGATKYITKGESKKTKAKKVYRINQSANGQFKSVTRVAGVSGIGSASAATLKAELKNRIKKQIDKAVLSKYHAHLKRDKKKFQKTIISKKSELRKLS